MAEAEENVAPVAGAGGKGKILPVLLILNTLLLTGVLIFVMKKPSGGAAGKEKDEKGEHAAEGDHAKGAPATAALGPMTRFDNFTVQLKSADVDRYARMSLELESPNDISKAAVEKRVPPIRDAVLGYLTDRTAEELRGSDGLKQVKQALLQRLEEIVPGNHVKSLFITDFIIQ
jgi:flagellar FliL protein